MTDTRFTLPCSIFKSCTNKNCGFAHSIEELRIHECNFGLNCRNKNCKRLHPNQTKADVCKKLNIELPDKKPQISLKFIKPCVNVDTCTNADCLYAHSMEELRVIECGFGVNCRNESCNRLHPNQTKESVCQKLNIVLPPKRIVINLNYTKPCLTFDSCTNNECLYAHSVEELVVLKCNYDEKCNNNACSRLHSNQTKEDVNVKMEWFLPLKRINQSIIIDFDGECEEDELMRSFEGMSFKQDFHYREEDGMTIFTMPKNASDEELRLCFVMMQIGSRTKQKYLFEFV